LIRKITPAGVVTTYVGNGTFGLVNGPAAAAEFTNPYGVAVDAGGNVYVAVAPNNDIRKITSAGVVSTLAGNGSRGFADGTGTAAEFDEPYGIGVDAQENVYVSDTENNRIRHVTPGGVVTTLAGSSTLGYVNGTGAAAEFRYGAGASGSRR